MQQFLVAIYHPDDYDPSKEGEAMARDIAALNEEMKAARVRIFVGGLSPARSARSLRAQPGGKVLVTDGPYIETKEHIGGFWVLAVANLDEALEWARKAAVACRAPVEVRQVGQRVPIDWPRIYLTDAPAPSSEIGCAVERQCSLNSWQTGFPAKSSLIRKWTFDVITRSASRRAE